MKTFVYKILKLCFLSITIIFLAALTTSKLRAVDWDEYEYEPGEGLHHEEWYDPTDWFDTGKGIDYEDDDWGYDYDSYDHNFWYDDYDYDDWYYDYDYDYYPERDAYYPYTTREDYFTDQYRSNSNEQGLGRGQRVLLSGKIAGFRKANVRRGNRSDEFTVVKLHLSDGRSALVDLGRHSNLDRLDLKEGDKIIAGGVRRSINGQQVILAEKIKVDGKFYDIRRVEKGSRRSAKSYTFSGTIEDTKQMTTRGIRGVVNLLRVRLKDGERVIINLGPNTTLQDLDVQQGDWIRVQGQQGIINNSPVLFATSVSAHGKTHEIRQWRNQRPRVQTGQE